MTFIEPFLSQAALTAAASPELSLLVKATLLLGAGLLAARLLRRARAAVRHVVLASTLATIAALPAAAALMPEVLVTVSPAERQPDAQQIASGAPIPTELEARSDRSAAAPSAPSLEWTAAGLGRGIWAFGAIVLLLRFGYGSWRLRRLHREGLPALESAPLADRLVRETGVRGVVRLLVHEGIAAPMTSGLRRTTIVLPPTAASWGPGELRRALVHELEHARRYDWALQMAARVVCALYWFHPLVWVVWRELRLEAERACDDAVVRSADTADYAHQLVALARRLSGASAELSVAMAARSDLSRRVTALLDARQRRGRAGATSVLAGVAVSLVTLALVAPVQAIVGPSEDGGSLMDLLSGDFEQVRTPRRDQSLYRAAARGNTDRIIELIDAGADVNRAIDGDGSPLIGAARGGHLAAVKLLLDRGADPNLAVPGDGNALIMAAREGHAEVVALLLDRGANIDQVVEGDETALIQASGAGRLAVVRLLLQRKADVNIRVWADAAFERPDGEWRTALSMARRGRHAAIVDLLLAAGARE